MKRILVVGAHNLFRQSLAVVVGQELDLEVVAQAGSLAEAHRASRVCDVAVVVDLLMPDGDGGEFVERQRPHASRPGHRHQEHQAHPPEAARFDEALMGERT